jgi:DNA polymerase V
MDDAGIADDDELVVDRSLVPADGNVVVAILDGELTVKRLRLDHGRSGWRPRTRTTRTSPSRNWRSSRSGAS